MLQRRAGGEWSPVRGQNRLLGRVGRGLCVVAKERIVDNAVWAEPPADIGIDECYFYHTMDIPGHGLVTGEWDLRGREGVYLGGIPLQGKRVLEIGAASGHLSFTMEKMGAEVVSYDLSERQEWDLVPYADGDKKAGIDERKRHIRRLNNGYWFAHRAFRSAAKVMYGTVYKIPDNVGQFDVCTFGSVLLHLRDPFLALQRVTRHANETVVVTDLMPPLLGRAASTIGRWVGGELLYFLPNARRREHHDAWWLLSPSLVAEFLHILGFKYTDITRHRQRYNGKSLRLYTVVGRRGSVRGS